MHLYSVSNNQIVKRQPSATSGNTDISNVLIQKVSPKKALQSKVQERQAIMNRLRYLTAEQEKYERQIMSTKTEIERRNQFKQSKLQNLRDKIEVLRERESELTQLTEQINTNRDKNQSQKLKSAYEKMLIFEAERQHDR